MQEVFEHILPETITPRTHPRTSPKHKTCSKCGESKPLTDFHKQSKCKDGRRAMCKDCASSYHLSWREADSVNSRTRLLLANCKKRAKYKNRYFELDYDWLHPRLLDGCAITGIEFDIDPQKRKAGEWNSPSIDRIDNTKGYTKDNCRVILHRLNMLKRDGTDDDMIRRSLESGDSFFVPISTHM